STLTYSCTHRRPTRSTLSPYTTLFRSLPQEDHREEQPRRHSQRTGDRRPADQHRCGAAGATGDRVEPGGALQPPGVDQVVVEDRSEEHTSELQSRENLVCRLLLAKKKA